MKRLSTVCVLVVAATGCTVHQDDWAREFGVALCKHEQECHKVSTAVDCTRPGFWAVWPEELEAIREGLVTYSAADARRCADLLSKVGCIDDLKARLFSSVECRVAFAGQLGEGAPCTRAAVDVCGRDLRCSHPAGQFSSLCGTCTAVAKVDEEVTNSRGSKECGVGLYPDFDGGITGRCRPRPSLGQSCSSSRPCLELLECSHIEGGICGRPAAPAAGRGEIGETCLTAPHLRPQCAWPATCDEACWGPTVPAIPSADAGPIGEGCPCVDRTARVGEACSVDSPCELDARCVEGVCVFPSAREGEPCGQAACIAGLACGYDFVCEPSFSLCR